MNQPSGTTKISGWGRWPQEHANIAVPRDASEIKHKLGAWQGIARGLGRSYGDSSLAAQVFDATRMDHILVFDDTTGKVTCRTGVSLETLLNIFVPKGWFLPVTPGTKFVTVGGAIASDVHGKNHHVDGSFCNHVESIRIMIASGETVECSRDEKPDLFWATCGGMGLTGIIIEATFTMKRISSAYINETIYKTPNLKATFEAFDAHKGATYSVAWIDCLAKGKSLGRSLLMLGEHAQDGRMVSTQKRRLTVPFDFPKTAMNRFSIGAFNAAYYHRIRKHRIEHTVPYDPFFYPLDSVHNWNRMYGKGGFVQYQFVLPTKSGLDGMTMILDKIARSGRASFLAVLKALGPKNKGMLSFSRQGYTLALDFQMRNGLLSLLDELDAMVIDHDGRIYLSKDARMTADTFRRGHPELERFTAARERYGAKGVFESMQSKRLGI